MKRSIAVLGAAGKMGLRVSKKLAAAGYDLRAVEISEVGNKRLAAAELESFPSVMVSKEPPSL